MWLGVEERGKHAGRAKWLVSPAPLGFWGGLTGQEKATKGGRAQGEVASSAAQGFCGRCSGCTQDKGEGGLSFDAFFARGHPPFGGYTRMMDEDEHEHVDANVTEEYAWSPGLTQFHKHESLPGMGVQRGQQESSLCKCAGCTVVMPHGGRVYGRRRGRGLL